jgi:hypothetical protein
VIGNLLCRCIEAARKISYVLDQDQVVEMLVRDPSAFAKLVQEEHYDRTEYAYDRLTAKLDAVTELGQFEALDAFDVTFPLVAGAGVNLEPVLDLVNRLTRTFVVYIGNMITIFEKEFQLFMERFRQSLQQGGVDLTSAEFTVEDMAELEKRAQQYLSGGQFLQALSLERLLNSDVITKPALDDAVQFADLVKFILRACYISQGTWQDSFVSLVEVVNQAGRPGRRFLLIDRIEKDAVFCCNLLCESYATLRSWSPLQRRAAIEAAIDRLGRPKAPPSSA